MEKQAKENNVYSKYEKPTITCITLESFSSILLACGHGVLNGKIRKGEYCQQFDDGLLE